MGRTGDGGRERATCGGARAALAATGAAVTAAGRLRAGSAADGHTPRVAAHGAALRGGPPASVTTSPPSDRLPAMRVCVRTPACQAAERTATPARTLAAPPPSPTGNLHPAGDRAATAAGQGRRLRPKWVAVPVARGGRTLSPTTAWRQPFPLPPLTPRSSRLPRPPPPACCQSVCRGRHMPPTLPLS